MMILLVLLLGVSLTETAKQSCPEAKLVFDSCITRGYEAKHLKYCVVHPENTVPKSDKSCKKAEKLLHKNCGYRQCAEHFRADDVALPPPGNEMAAASDNEICTKIGSDTLEKGGSGADAAISILLCLGAVQPQSNGIGGGGFMVVHTRDEDKAINFREMAPKASTQEMFVEDSSLAVNGGLASGVPGPVAGYWKAHKLYGRLNWAELFAPTIALLREPITVTSHMEHALSRTKGHLIKDKNAKKIFFNDPKDQESYKRAGETYRNDRLAAAYQSIADNGPKAFYSGQIGKNIVKATKATGGIMTMRDLAHYKVLVQEPLQFEYRSKKVLAVPPPASGHVMSIMLQLLENFDLSSQDARAWSQIIEAMRFGYAVRGQTGDPDFSEKTKWVVEKIQNGTWAEEILKEHVKKNKNQFRGPYDDVEKYMQAGPLYENFDGTHTTHVSVLGPNGSAVSCTSTVNLYFGSRVMTDDGIIMNNQMDDFSTPGAVNSFGFPAAPENFIVPGKRPMSSTSASIILDDEGRARFVSGAAGGSKIITSTLLSIINALDWDMTLEENYLAKRIHDQLRMETRYEPGFDETLLEELREMGYNMVENSGTMAVVTSVSSLSEETEASVDPRKQRSR